MKTYQIALTLFTLRDHCQDESNFKSTLKLVREIGYKSVQISGVNIDSDVKLKEFTDEAGLKICATHEPSETIIENPKKVIERLEILDCHYTAFPHPGRYSIETLEDTIQLARQLDISGAILREAGKVLTYHNHDNEFFRHDGRTVLELIFEKTDPKNLQGEIDTFWIQKGGGDPVFWCRKLQGRLPLLHLKDYRITLNRQVEFAEVGQGNLDWPRIIEAAEDSGCEWFIVEQDQSTRDPFESVKMSFDFLTSLAQD